MISIKLLSSYSKFEVVAKQISLHSYENNGLANNPVKKTIQLVCLMNQTKGLRNILIYFSQLNRIWNILDYIHYKTIYFQKDLTSIYEIINIILC